MYRPRKRAITCPNCNQDHYIDVNSISPHVHEKVTPEGDIEDEGYYECSCGHDFFFDPETTKVKECY